MRKRDDYPRTLPEPALTPYDSYKTIFRLEIPIDGSGSSYEIERKSLSMEGFGSMLFLDYLALAKKKAADFIRDGGWKVSADLSDIRGVNMIIFRDTPQARKSEAGTQ